MKSFINYIKEAQMIGLNNPAPVVDLLKPSDAATPEDAARLKLAKLARDNKLYPYNSSKLRGNNRSRPRR